MERNVMEKCPTCAARFRREGIMQRFNDEITVFLQQSRFVKLESCIYCVEKHVSRAMVYYEEMLSARGSGMPDGTAKVSVYKNHLKILGHLGCAIEESEEYNTLNEILIQAERNYRYEGVSPDWDRIIQLIIEVKNANKQEQ